MPETARESFPFAGSNAEIWVTFPSWKMIFGCLLPLGFSGDSEWHKSDQTLKCARLGFLAGSRWGFTRQPENSKLAHVEGQRIQKDHQIPRNDPPVRDKRTLEDTQRERRKERLTGGRRGNKSAKFGAVRWLFGLGLNRSGPTRSATRSPEVSEKHFSSDSKGDCATCSMMAVGISSPNLVRGGRFVGCCSIYRVALFPGAMSAPSNT